MLDQISQQALVAKKEMRNLNVSLDELERSRRLEHFDSKAFLSHDYDDFEVGRFESLDLLNLRWIEPDWFEYMPSADMPFKFIRRNGEQVRPGRMFTDGGSIPRIAWLVETLSPWGYVPAYLVHDWEFDLHFCGQTSKSFEDVRDTMLEALKTLMVSGVVPESRLTFDIIHSGINSPIARKIWEQIPPECPLPPNEAKMT
jgi:hypothetical protein